MGDIYNNPPQSRNEAILRATIDGTEYEAPPQSRIEDLLIELKEAIEQGACTGNYNDLSNKPQINGVALQGDKSISDLFDGKVDIGVGTVEESGYAELKDENGDRIFRAGSANGGAAIESGALIGQPGALVLYNGEGGLGSISPKGGASLVEVDLPAESGTLALDSQIASSQTPAKAAVVTVTDAAPINAEDITVDITPKQDLHGYDKPWAGGAGKNLCPINDMDVAANTLDAITDKIHIGDQKTYIISMIIARINGVTISNNALFPVQIRTYDSNDTQVDVINPSPIDLTSGSTTFQKSFTVSNNASYMIVNLRNRNDDGNINTRKYDVQLEIGSTPTSYAPYSNICPIEGWTGAELTQKDDATNPTVTHTYTVNFGETVYGGKWHVTEGGTDKTHANIANYNGETINEPWLSSLDEYSPGATPTIGAQVVYPLTTPTTISTPKQNVPMLQGINTVSADCGDVSLKYQPDNVIGELKGEIQELESELDKLDKAYMASDTFSERGIDGEYQITRISNEIHIAVVIDDASIATQTGSVDLIADLPDDFKCDPSYGAVLALRHSSGTGKIEFKINPGITTQNFYMYVEEVNTTSGVWFPIYDVPGKAL